ETEGTLFRMSAAEALLTLMSFLVSYTSRSTLLVGRAATTSTVDTASDGVLAGAGLALVGLGVALAGVGVAAVGAAVWANSGCAAKQPSSSAGSSLSVRWREELG